MISSFGPLSASKVSISAQTKELTQLMNDLYAKEEAVSLVCRNASCNDSIEESM